MAYATGLNTYDGGEGCVKVVLRRIRPVLSQCSQRARTALHPNNKHITVEKLKLVSPVVMLWAAPATGI